MSSLSTVATKDFEWRLLFIFRCFLNLDWLIMSRGYIFESITLFCVSTMDMSLVVILYYFRIPSVRACVGYPFRFPRASRRVFVCVPPSLHASVPPSWSGCKVRTFWWLHSMLIGTVFARRAELIGVVLLRRFLPEIGVRSPNGWFHRVEGRIPFRSVCHKAYSWWLRGARGTVERGRC